MTQYAIILNTLVLDVQSLLPYLEILTAARQRASIRVIRSHELAPAVLVVGPPVTIIPRTAVRCQLVSGTCRLPFRWLQPACHIAAHASEDTEDPRFLRVCLSASTLQPELDDTLRRRLQMRSATHTWKTCNTSRHPAI